MRNLKKLSALTALATGLFGIGVAFAAWTDTGSGGGHATADSVHGLTVVDGTGTIANKLSPNNSGDVVVDVTNNNPFKVHVTGIAQTASTLITSGDATCDTSNGVSYTAPTIGSTDTAYDIAAGATKKFVLTNAAAMSNLSVNACQGKTFTVSLTVNGSSIA